MACGTNPVGQKHQLKVQSPEEYEYLKTLISLHNLIEDILLDREQGISNVKKLNELQRLTKEVGRKP
jgi:hypothetical protein